MSMRFPNPMTAELGSVAPMLKLSSQLLDHHGERGYLEEDLSTLVMKYEAE